MDPLRVLFLSDQKPGHHNFADGVLAAITKLRPVQCVTLPIRIAFPWRMRAVQPLIHGGPAALRLALKLGFDVDAAALPGNVDLVLSGGGDTLSANIAAARLLGAANIFAGSLRRGLGYDRFSLVVSSYDRAGDPARHIGTLKPSIHDPAQFTRPPPGTRFGADNPPRRAGLLLGGRSGYFRYRTGEWLRLFRFVRELNAAWGTKWLISTSRRTPGGIADRAAALARDGTLVECFVDFRTAGPGTLLPIFRDADVMVCTTDSSSMLSEAIAVRLPVIGVTPARHGFKPDEARYRDRMVAMNWCRFLPIAELEVARFGQDLAEVVPTEVNHLDRLATEIRRKLPELFDGHRPGGR